MYVNKHPPPLIHTYTYRHSVLYPHTHKIHLLETTSLYNSLQKIRLLYTIKNTNTVHTDPLTKRHHNNRSQGLWSDYLQLTQTNKFQDPPPTPLKNFGTPHFLLQPPPPPLQLKFWLVPYHELLFSKRKPLESYLKFASIPTLIPSLRNRVS